MDLRLDHESPVPLYHQIAEAVAYRIATGRLGPGVLLPSVREAAPRLGVNLHTVRRAYTELARLGLVKIDGARGTRVAAETAVHVHTNRAAAAVERFVRRILSEASEKHGLTPQELGRRIINWSPPAATVGLSFVECSASQCHDHCDEIEARWRVSARPWPLSKSGSPPPGTIVATYFHHHEIHRRWPGRRSDLHFVAIQPDPDLSVTLKKLAARRSGRTALLCEFDEPKAMNIAADVASQLSGTGWRIEPRVCKRSGEALKAAGRHQIVLFSPRAWSRLSAAEKSDPRAVKVRYVILPEELEALGVRLEWRDRHV